MTALINSRVVLRIGDAADWRSWRAVREASAAYLKPWEPTWPIDALSHGRFLSQINRHCREWREGRGYAFQICLREGQDEKEVIPWIIDEKSDRARVKKYRQLPIVGGIALNEVTHGIAHKATLGYWVGEAYAGQGLATEAVELICRFSFEILKLHRIEASCIPYNEPSKRLLSRVGFVREGVARDYLKINGRWADHILWGRVSDSF